MTGKKGLLRIEEILPTEIPRSKGYAELSRLPNTNIFKFNNLIKKWPLVNRKNEKYIFTH